ncbi:hypothetical protein ACTXT7_006879 [Hymenolepis weldensis]
MSNRKQSVNIHNKIYKTTPAPCYHGATVRPTDSGSLKLQTVSSRSLSANICKISRTNEADTIPSTTVFGNTIATPSSQHLHITSVHYAVKLRQAGNKKRCT